MEKGGSVTQVTKMGQEKKIYIYKKYNKKIYIKKKH
jgi:hypothetical protein